MKYRNVTSARIGRKTNLALALAMALALGGGVATMAMANPGSPDQTQYASAAEQQAQQMEAAFQAQRATDETRAVAQPMATTWYTSNCHDSGGGSLRDMIATAASGDSIDMTTMSCKVINLNSTIDVSQSSLTLLGKEICTFRVGTLCLAYEPDTHIHGGVAKRAFNHTGTGTLTFNAIDLSDSEMTNSSYGACIHSMGSVTLYNSWVHDCKTIKTGTSTFEILGGAIYAAGSVNLTGRNVVFGSSHSGVYNNVASAADGDVFGGAIYAGNQIWIYGRSDVYGNLAESINGNVNGGGVYTKSSVRLDANGSSVRNNTAKTTGALTKIKGAGIYAEKTVSIVGSVTGNKAVYPYGTSVYYGRGVGVFAETAVFAYPGSRFTNNISNTAVFDGGAIYTNGSLTLTGATVADNYAGANGAILAKGNVTIKTSTISGNRSYYAANIRLGDNATVNTLIQSSTISNNTITNSSDSGAGLYLTHGATIENSTITGNIEKNSTDSKRGAGISLDTGINVSLKSTIVSGNSIKSGSTTTPSDIGYADGKSGSTLSGYYNLLGQMENTLAYPSQTQIVLHPKLGPLQGNGGTTQTHLPAQTSLAIGNGLQITDSTDQRGEPRKRNGQVDIGAVQLTQMELYDRIFADGFQ